MYERRRRNAASIAPHARPTDRRTAVRSTGVFLADDHAVVREGAGRVLESAEGFHIVGEADTGPMAIRGILRVDPDLAVVDVRMPGVDGIEVIEELRSRGSRTPCLVLTSFWDEATFLRCKVAGAVGYVLKSTGHTDFVAACRRVVAGESLMDPALLASTGSAAPPLPPREPLDDLSPQERRILALVGEGLTNGEIGDRLHLAEKTVRNYVSVMLAKLGVRNRTQAATYAARTSVSLPQARGRPGHP